MYRFLLTPRWVALFVIAVLTVPGCVWLAGWQFDRLHHAQRENHRVRDNASAPVAQLSQVAPVGGPVRREDEYRKLVVSGRYDTEHQLFVRNRPRDGAQGFQVLTPVVPATGPAVLVDRGWVAAPTSGSPEGPQTPTGPVTVTGYLRPPETASTRVRETSDLPTGQILHIDVPAIAQTLPYPVHAGYLQLAEQQPPAPVVDGRSVPNPDELPGSSSELLHLSYAWQWYVFATIGPIGFLFLARREAADRFASDAREQARQHI